MHAYDLSIPAVLSAALLPDLILMVGAMLLLLWAVWRPESSEHQRSVGVLSIGLCVVTFASIVYMMGLKATATDGPIAIDNFRWMIDVIILIGAVGAIALTMDDND